VTGSSSASVQYRPDQGPTLPTGEFLSGQAIEDLPGNVSYQKGSSHVFFSEIDPSGSYLLEATLAGASGTDQGQALTIQRVIEAILPGYLPWSISCR
jgi:hypothetical protein